MITAVLTLIAWFFSKERKRLPFDATVWLILAFMADISITTSLAVDPAVAFDMWERVTKELLFVLITIAMTTNRIRFHALLWVMAIAIGYYGLKGGAFMILHGGDYMIFGPPDTVISDNNDLAAGLTVALPLMNYVRMTSAHRWVRSGLLVVMAGSFLAIPGSYSRAALLGLVAVSIFLWLKSGKKLLSGIVVALALILSITFMPEKYLERMQTIGTYQQDTSAMGRIQIWGTAIKIALARPLIGGGFKVTELQAVVDRYDPGIEARAPHNIYLGVLAEHGFIGLFIWAAMLLVSWRNSRWIQRYSKSRPEWQWAGDFARMSEASLVAYCVVGAFGNYQYWDYYFTIVGLLAVTRRIMRQAAVPQRSAAALTVFSPAAQ
jgi:probable O-glycosylation ligase (exosortase A-associated)